MVTLKFSHQSLVGGSTIGMGIKKAQTPSILSHGPTTAPNILWWRLRYGAQLQWIFDFAHNVSFEVVVRVRD